MKDYLENIIALSLIKGVGAAFMKKYRPVLIKYRADIDLLSMMGGKVNSASLEETLPRAKEIIDLCREEKIGILTIADDWYPQLLLEIKDPPPILYYKGRLENIKKPLAIIGTRNSSDLGNKIAARISKHFSSDYSICNGLSEGIDQRAIKENGKVIKQVIGVMPGGLKIEASLLPRTAQIAQEVLSNEGLLLSEFAPDRKEDVYSPVKTCRIQAGLSKGVILIQSPMEGSSKYTIRTFSEVDRPLGVISYEGNKEFDSNNSFAANRKIIKEKTKALEAFIKTKKSNQIKLKTIIPIAKSADYDLFKTQLESLKDNGDIPIA